MINYNFIINKYTITHTHTCYIHIILLHYNVLCKLHLNLWCYQMEITEEGYTKRTEIK